MLNYPVYTDRLKPTIEHAARWFFGAWPSVETKTSVVGNGDIDAVDKRKKDITM